MFIFNNMSLLFHLFFLNLTCSCSYSYNLILAMVVYVALYIRAPVKYSLNVLNLLMLNFQFFNSCSISTFLNPCEKKSIINVWISLFSVADWSITQLCFNPWVRQEFHATFPVKMLRFAKCHCINKIV